MALGAPIVLTAIFLEDDHLVAARLRNDLGEYGGLRKPRRIEYRGAPIFGDHQHIVELEGFAGVSRQSFDGEPLIFGHPVLFSTGADYGVH